MLSKKFVWVFLGLLSGLLLIDLALPAQAHAGYLDPGSGSLLIQGIVATMAFFGRLTARVKSFFRSKSKMGN